MTRTDLSGIWEVRLSDGTGGTVVLPGTLDENQIGYPDVGSAQWHPDAAIGHEDALIGRGCILTRLTRKYTYEGPAVFRRMIRVRTSPGERAFIEVERSRELSVFCNGREAACTEPATVSTRGVYEITACLAGEKNTLEICCDNSYPSWPHDAIVLSSAATEETQTNWNGLIGELLLRTEKENYIFAIHVYPSLRAVDLVAELDCASDLEDVLVLTSDAFAAPVTQKILVPAGRHVIRIPEVPLADGVRLWDEDEGNLYELTAAGTVLEEKSVRFGVRTFAGQGGIFALNGRRILVRSEANCGEYPETGHMPMTVDAWKSILGTYHSYGLNCVRFHSHCPPDAAFAAADEMGILLQPELSHWNPETAFEDDKSWAYYNLEVREILRTYANHPSFVMLTFGNELHCGALGHKRMDLLLERAHRWDASRLYANGSNVHYGRIGTDPCSDFYSSAGFYEESLRGTSAQMEGYINRQYPDSRTNFDKVMGKIRKEYVKPVFTFEVGQYEVLPDFDEIADFRGVTRPDNYVYVRDCAEKKGWMPVWKQWVEATGELSVLAYREEVEAVRRTEGLAGISMLGLQDFPGQGTALVGVLNAHLQQKPFAFARPEHLRCVLGQQVLLALLPRYTYTSAEMLRVQIKLSNFGKRSVTEALHVQLTGGRNADAVVLDEAVLAPVTAPSGSLTLLGSAAFALDRFTRPAALGLRLALGDLTNTYPVWVYPEEEIVPADGVMVTRDAEEALSALKEGGAVLLDPPAQEEHFPHSIQAQFTTDFWSTGTFPKQSGFMGYYIHREHPALAQFPTSFHTDWQWWPLSRGRAMILPDDLSAIVDGLDCCAHMRRLGALLEAEVGGGRLLLSSMGILDQQQYPEGRALLRSLVAYMSGRDFAPQQALTVEQLRTLVN